MNEEMRNRLILTEVKVSGTKVEYCYQAQGPWREFFHGQESYVNEYAFDVSRIPESVLTVSFLGNILPAVWVCDAEVQTASCDEDFYSCLPEVRKGFEAMYPMLSFGGKISAGRLEKNSPRGGENSAAMLYSGGVDAWYTLLCHLEEKPLLAFVWGGDVPLSETEGACCLKDRMEETAACFGLDTTVIRSAFREAVTNRDFTPAVKKSGDQYWHGFQHGLALLTLMAPVVWEYGIRTLYIASSFKKGDHYTCASDPSIDNFVRCAGARVHHDGYDASRQQKIERIIAFSGKEGIPVHPHVCFNITDGKNCCRCKKCRRTILGFYAAGADPRDYGFENAPSLEETGKLVLADLEGQQGFLSSRYGPSQDALRERKRREELPEGIRWFYDADLAALDAGKKPDVPDAGKKPAASEAGKKPDAPSVLWEAKAYRLFRLLAGRLWDSVKDSTDESWRTEWKKFRYKRLASRDYENRHAPEFREKLKASEFQGSGKCRTAACASGGGITMKVGETVDPGKGEMKKRVLMSVIGVVVCGISVGFFKRAAYGVDPYQSLMSGLDALLPISYGTIYVAATLVLLFFALFADRHYIGLATIINLLFLGYIAQYTHEFLLKIFPGLSAAGRFVFLLIGIVTMCLASSFYFVADLGVSTYDAVSLIISETWHLMEFRWCRILSDLVCVALGSALYLLAGNPLKTLPTVVGIGTIITAFFMGPLIEFFKNHIARPFLYGKKNAGK